MTTQIDSGLSGAVSTFVDTYDPGGRKSNQLRDGVMSTFTMDNVGRLTLQNRGGDLSSFAYDTVGHLTLKHNAGESAVTMNRNLLGQVTTYVDGSTLCTNTWDPTGNLTNENIGGVLTSYQWDDENRMTSRAIGIGVMNFVYDESHHLRHKEIPGAEGEANASFNYLDDIVFTRYEEFFGTRTEQMTPWLGVTLGNSSHDFVLDSLGNVVGSVRSSGVGNKVAYFPYGEMEPTLSTPVSSYWKFVGGYGVYAYSDEVYLMWHRWYSANVGSFRSIDPLWPRESAYVYVNGMPQMAIDWEGLMMSAAVLAAIAPPVPRSRTRPHHNAPQSGGIFGGYDYGSYCGPSNKRNPAWKVYPQDCIDACCLAHDRCLEAHYGAGKRESSAHTCCDALLYLCAEQVYNSNCCFDSPTPMGCRWAAKTISFFFGILSTSIFDPRRRYNCVPERLWGYYSRINWGGVRDCQGSSVASPYMDFLSEATPYDPERPPTYFGGRIVGRSGGAPVFD